MKLATLCYVKHNGKTLMIHRIKKADDIHKGKWNGLGGKIKPGESPEECVIREVMEESGLKLEKPELKGLLLFKNFKGDDWYVFVFIAEKFSGKLSECEEGELAWIKDEQLPRLNLWESDRVFFKWLNREGFFSAKFVYEGEKFKDYKVWFYPNKCMS
ncbi:DNA mismatch repair protein MutT [Candidatus Woesearchaeota archaeon]|nr:MAG: DNA mismatch repair protein MutT [Candidatus Woesearchaeota archaeon]